MKKPLLLEMKIKENGYQIRYNQEINERIAEKLSKFKRGNDDKIKTLDKIFSKVFSDERNWIVGKQIEIAEYLCREQTKYLQTQNPFDKKQIDQQDIAEYIGHSGGCVSRLMKNLT